MAKRANQTFVVGTKDGKKIYERNAVVPADVAKGHDDLVYDDTKPRAEDSAPPFVRTASPAPKATKSDDKATDEGA